MFTPPARKSMSDIELQNALGAAQADEAGILGAMELLERQSALREEDDRAFSEWSQRLNELGTPEALRAIENGRRLIAGLEPLEFVQPSVQPEILPEEQPEILPEEQPEARTELSPEKQPEELADQIAAAFQNTESSISAQAYDDAVAESLSALYSPIRSIQESQTDAFPQLESEDFSESEVASFSHIEAEPELDQIINVPAHGEDSKQQSATPIALNETYKKGAKFDLSQLAPWFSVNNVGFAVLLAFGVHLIATDALSGLLGLFVGILAANLPIAAAVIAAKRSGRDALFVSRAAFGVIGNQIPGWVFLLSRLIATASALAMAVHVLTQKASEITGVPTASPWIVAAAVALTCIAFALGQNFKLQAATNLFGAAVSFLLAIAIAACLAPLFSFSNIDFAKSQNSNLIEISALVFALIVSLWLPSAADFASTLDKSTLAFSALTATSIGSFVVPLVLSVFFYLAFAGASQTWSNQLKSGLLGNMSDVSPLAFWLLTIALVLSSLLWATNSIASVRGMLKSLIEKAPARLTSALSAFSFLAAIFVLLGLAPNGNLPASILSIFELSAIPALAWAGIFTSDVFLRRVAYHEVSLSRSYGFYKSANIANLVGWLLSVATGVALLQPASNFKGLEFIGFARSFAPSLAEAVSASGAVFFIVFALSALFPVAFGILRIKEQEREALALEARRDDLKDIFKFGE